MYSDVRTRLREFGLYSFFVKEAQAIRATKQQALNYIRSPMSNEMLVFCKSLEGPFTCLLDILDFATHDLDGDWLGRSAKWVLVFAGLHSSVCGTLQSIGTLLSAAQNRGEACGEEYMCKDQFANVVLHCEYISFVDSEQHFDNQGMRHF